MTEMYGSLWSNSQGDEPNETWAMGLDILSPKEIGAGLVALRDSAKPFPPTLPEFIGLCRHQNAPAQHLMSRPCHEVLSAPIVDKGEGNPRLGSPQEFGYLPRNEDGDLPVNWGLTDNQYQQKKDDF